MPVAISSLLTPPPTHPSHLQMIMAQRLEGLRLGFEARLAEWQAATAARTGVQDRHQGVAPQAATPHYQQAPQAAHPQPEQQPVQQARSMSRAGSAAAQPSAAGMPPRLPSREGLHAAFGAQQQLAQQGQAQQGQERQLDILQQWALVSILCHCWPGCEPCSC